MPNNDLRDWRISEIATRLTRDVPAAYPGGPSHKAGTPVYLATIAKHEEYNTLGFVTPSPIALALDIACKSSLEAERLRTSIPLEDAVTPWGQGKAVRKDDLPQLYDFFECAMTAVTFSFQSLESFANWVIGRRIKDSFPVQRRHQIVELAPHELERNLSTEEKVAQVLPKVFGLPTPKGKKVWQSFKKLKHLRDSTIHLKSFDVAPKQLDERSLFFEFLNSRTTDFPKLAFEVIEYFYAKEDEPRWAKQFRGLMGRESH